MFKFRLRSLFLLLGISSIACVTWLNYQTNRDKKLPTNIEKLLINLGKVKYGENLESVIARLKTNDFSMNKVERSRNFNDDSNVVLHYSLGDEYLLRIFASQDTSRGYGVENFQCGVLLERTIDDGWAEWRELPIKSKTRKPIWAKEWEFQNEWVDSVSKNFGLKATGNVSGFEDGEKAND